MIDISFSTTNPTTNESIPLLTSTVTELNYNSLVKAISENPKAAYNYLALYNPNLTFKKENSLDLVYKKENILGTPIMSFSFKKCKYSEDLRNSIPYIVKAILKIADFKNRYNSSRYSRSFEEHLKDSDAKYNYKAKEIDNKDDDYISSYMVYFNMYMQDFILSSLESPAIILHNKLSSYNEETSNIITDIFASKHAGSFVVTNAKNLFIKDRYIDYYSNINKPISLSDAYNNYIHKMNDNNEFVNPNHYYGLDKYTHTFIFTFNKGFKYLFKIEFENISYEEGNLDNAHRNNDVNISVIDRMTNYAPITFSCTVFADHANAINTKNGQLNKDIKGLTLYDFVDNCDFNLYKYLI